jgi:hypothetical protein
MVNVAVASDGYMHTNISGENKELNCLLKLANSVQMWGQNDSSWYQALFLIL